nr:hypothetical protein [uncultured bacterium]
MKKLILLLFIPIAISLLISCGENSKKKVENIPDRLIQVWDQSKCEVCDDPWREWNEKIDDYTNLISLKDEYGDKSMTAESYVLFKNVPLSYAEGYKRNASFVISYKYYAKNCWGAERRDANLSLGSPGYWSEKNVEWIKNANNGDRFDVLMYQPEFEQENPSSACDYTTFDIVPANYDKIVVFPAGELNIEQTGDYKFKGAQGDFKLISNNIYKDNNLNTKEMAEVEDINLAIITDPNGTTNVRSGKGTNNPVIYELKTNETFDVYPSNDKWWLVKLNNKQKGYIFYDRVSLIRNNLDGKYTNASNYFLDEDDLINLSKNELKIMRNEIFARYGYIFREGGEMNDYFKDQKWYTPKYKNVNSKITNLEKFNIKKIKSYEDGSAYDRLVPDPENNTRSKTNNSTTKSKPTSVNGKYSYSEPNLIWIINVYGSSWSGESKFCQYCDVEFARGIVKGNKLYDPSGYIDIGYISGNTLYFQVPTGIVEFSKN